MTSFEKRLSRLETAHNVRFQGRWVGVIFDTNVAHVHGGGVCYERPRLGDETPADFERRIIVEAGKLGSQLIAMTRQEFNEVAARLEKEV